MPEKWNVLGREDVVAEAAEPLDGPSLTLCARLASEFEVDGALYAESENTLAGEEVVAAELPGGRLLGMSVS